ncbi:protein ImuA [Thalassospira sp. MA62]|nr:protein ImuA [Thalassospira sp. MA62]
MSDRRLHQARTALARAEQQWKSQVSGASGATGGVIPRVFGGLDLSGHISIGGLASVGLHEVMCGHDDGAASLLAWYLAVLPQPNDRMNTGFAQSARQSAAQQIPSSQHLSPSTTAMTATETETKTKTKMETATVAAMATVMPPDIPTKPVFWIRQRRALDQGGFYPLCLPQYRSDPDALMLTVDQQQTALWACEEVARSGQVGTVLIETTDYDLTTARRLQLACESGESRIIVMRPAPRSCTFGHHRGLPPSSAWTRWQISPDIPNSKDAQTHATPSYIDPTGNYHHLSLIGGRGVRPGSWKVKTDAATFSISVADPLENRLSRTTTAATATKQHAHAGSPPHG